VMVRMSIESMIYLKLMIWKNVGLLCMPTTLLVTSYCVLL